MTRCPGTSGHIRMPVLTVLLAASIVLCVATPALAFVEPNPLTGGGCLACHVTHPTMSDPVGAGVCVDCHGGPYEGAQYAEGFTPTDNAGPHGGYTTTTRKCGTCHSVHDAPGAGVTLLPAATIWATCFTCHDGTGGWGVYGTLAARSATVGGGHRYNQTSAVPGGDPITGGPSTGTVFEANDGTLTCTDCHSPHGSDVVEAFVGERRRIRATTAVSVADYSSTRLLRRSPTSANASISEYGSDWCLACHKGRDSGSLSVHNHPVETASTYPDAATRFIYRRLAILDSGSATWTTVRGQLGGTENQGAGTHDPATNGVIANPQGNRGYLMPYPRTTTPVPDGQSGHKPICQQCHEDTRDLGNLAADGSADVVEFSVAYADSVIWDGSSWTTATVDNPRFQNFPHETENAYMLVEQYDDLCLNFHPVAQLP